MIINKNFSKFFYLAMFALLTVITTCWAKIEPTVETHLGVRWDIYMVMKSRNVNINNFDDDDWLDRVWMSSMKTDLVIDAHLSDRLTYFMKYYAIFLLTTPGSPSNPIPRRSGGGGLQDVFLTYSFSESDSLSPLLKIGVFPYDYTQPWQRLGGYLFRTGMYPGYVLPTYYEHSILGGSFSAWLPQKIQHDLIVTVETEQNPVNDISISYMGRFRNNGLEIGLGGMLHRLIRTEQGGYLNQESKPQFPITGEKDYLISDSLNWDPENNGNYFRHSGIKIVGRLSFNLTSFLQISKLSENDLTVYGEGAILGLTNYPGFYNKLIERTPLCFGITLPTFKLIDIAGVEIEYYSSRWKNDQPYDVPVPYMTYNVREDKLGLDIVNLEVPLEEQDGGEKAVTDNFKWAFFLEKSIKNKFFIGLHFASDHFRSPEAGGVGTEELLYAPDQWYWQMTLKTLF